MAVFQTQGCGVALLLWIRVVVDRQKPAPVGTVNTLRFIIFFLPDSIYPSKDRHIILMRLWRMVEGC